MAKKDKNSDKFKDRREFYALTLITVPTIMMAIVSQYISDWVTRFLAQALLFFLQAVIVKGLVENRQAE